MELATRKQRLLAITIDSVLITAAFAWAAYEAFPDSVRLVGLAVGAAVFGANLFYLARHGQTLGKKAVGVKIVTTGTNQNGGFVVNVLKRGFLSGLPYFLLTLLHPLLGALYIWADILFIYRSERRCVHDMIAGTLVVQC